MCFGDSKTQEIEPIIKEIKELKGVAFAEIEKLSEDHCHIEIRLNGTVPKRILIRRLNQLAGDKTKYIE